ncbi:MAG: class I SAM-dependent methyltransferase [Vicinamibacterales bacterium]|nr:class I SAM-dependent methyltransferase [Vicinamibacterales bacterium]
MSESLEVGANESALIPPKEMLYDGSSSPAEFVLYGDHFCQHFLIARAHMTPSAAVLDVGCGNGSVSRALTQVLTPAGQYEGVDVNGASISWLQERYRGFPNFHFSHADVYNKMYNPGGRLTAGDYRFPFADSAFDLVLLKSVFTHMMPVDVRKYIHEIDRVLKPGGRAVITYFLLNDESRLFIARGQDVHHLTHEYERDPLCRIANPVVPEVVVAHDEARIRGYQSEVGWSTLEIAYGNWSGRSSFLGHQDLIISAKEPKIPAPQR